MEDTLRDYKIGGNNYVRICLNPYYIGRYSMRLHLIFLIHLLKSLNPYYNGRYSTSQTEKLSMSLIILSLNPYYNGRYSMSGN